MTEAVMSVTVNVRDDRWWEVCCLNDEFPFEESRIEEDGGDDTKGPEVTFNPLETQGPGTLSGSRRRSYPGLEPIALDLGDPVLNIANSYSIWVPRLYALKVVETQLEHIVQCQEALFLVMKKDCQAYVSIAVDEGNVKEKLLTRPNMQKKSGLVNADKSQSYKTTLSADEIRKAIEYTLGYMGKLFDTVKQQHETSEGFLPIYLGIDKTKPHTSWSFRDSLFVGLNDKKDLRAMENCVGISHSIDRLHSLRHALESEIKSLKQLRDEVREHLDTLYTCSVANAI
jgi:hypothetical protein